MLNTIMNIIHKSTECQKSFSALFPCGGKNGPSLNYHYSSRIFLHTVTLSWDLSERAPQFGPGKMFCHGEESLWLTVNDNAWLCLQFTLDWIWWWAKHWLQCRDNDSWECSGKEVDFTGPRVFHQCRTGIQKQKQGVTSWHWDTGWERKIIQG